MRMGSRKVLGSRREEKKCLRGRECPLVGTGDHRRMKDDLFFCTGNTKG